MFKFFKKEKDASCCNIQIEEIKEECCTDQEDEKTHENAAK
jgi:hypothetical protein